MGPYFHIRANTPRWFRRRRDDPEQRSRDNITFTAYEGHPLLDEVGK